MPAPRTKRVPDALARLTFERLNRSGELPILLAFLWDMHDALRQRLDGMLATQLLTDAARLAEFQAAQGALEEVNRIARTFEALGTRESMPEPVSDTDGLFVRPPTPARPSRQRDKRPNGRF